MHSTDQMAAAPPAAALCPPESRKFVLVCAILASSMGFIDGSVVSLATPVIRSDLGGSLADAQWIINGYLLFLAALVLIGGAAGDVFGVRNIFASGVAVFIVTSLCCAAAPSISTLIAMRALQGIGAALMVPGSLAIIAKAYPAATRGRAIGAWASFSSITTAFGPLLGGALLSLGPPWMWRVIFAINVPIGLTALTLLLTRAPRDAPSERRRLDLPGALLATAGLGLFSWGLTAFGLPDVRRLAPPAGWLIAGGAAFAGFVWWERRTPQPMIKLGLFGSRAFSGANLYTLALFFGFGAILFYLPMTVISGWGVPEWQASLVFLPVSVFIGALSSTMGRLADRRGPRLFLTCGALLVGASYALLGLTTPQMRLFSLTLPIAALGGLGMSLLVSPLSAAVMLAAPDDDAGAASGVNNAVARAASLMAVAALGAVAGLVFKRALGDGAGIVQFGVAPMASLPPAAEALRIAATNRAFEAVAFSASAACFLAAAIAWFTQSARPPQRL